MLPKHKQPSLEVGLLIVDKAFSFAQLGKCQKSLISEHPKKSQSDFLETRNSLEVSKFIGNKIFPMILNFPVILVIIPIFSIGYYTESPIGMVSKEVTGNMVKVTGMEIR